MAPHVSRRRVGETWAAKGRKVPRGEGRTHVCYPHEWYQSVPHAHGVLRTARWACPHDLRAVRAAHPSARGPRKGRARTIVTCVITVRRVSVAQLSQVYNSCYFHDKPYLYTRKISVVTS